MEGFAAGEVAIGTQFVVVAEAFVHKGIALGFGHALEFTRLDVAKADVFHSVRWV